MKRRNITLGEMQDECKRVGTQCANCSNEVKKCCENMLGKNGYFNSPACWSFTDPRRFTEAQMALLRGLWDVGARKLIIHPAYDSRWAKVEREDRTMIACVELKAIGYGEADTEYEHIYLAELIGKDGEK